MALRQAGHWVDIIDHWSIIDHFAQMVDILEFVVDIALKWSIFHQNLLEGRTPQIGTVTSEGCQTKVV